MQSFQSVGHLLAALYPIIYSEFEQTARNLEMYMQT